MNTNTPSGHARFAASRRWRDTGILLLCALGLFSCRNNSTSSNSLDGSEPASTVPVTATLNVNVRNALYEGISGATVTVTVDGLQYVATTETQGNARFSDLPATPADVTVEAEGFESASMTHDLNYGAQTWSFSLKAEGAWADGRAIILGTEALQRASDGSRLTFSVDVAVIGGENPEPLLTLTDTDFELQLIDCGWGGPRDCASDADGNATGAWGHYSVEGTAQAFELRPVADRRPYLAGMLVEHFGNGYGWDVKGPALKSFFTALGGDDAIGLASVEFDGVATSTNILGPFTSDGTTYLAAIDRLGEPAGNDPPSVEGLLFDHVLDAIRWTAAAADEFPGRDPTLLLMTHSWLSLAQINEAVALARDNGVRIVTVDLYGWGSPELALRTGGFVTHVEENRNYILVLGAMDLALAGVLPYYRMEFTLAGSVGTFVPGGNARVYMHIDTPAPLVNRGTYTYFDVTIPD